MAHMTCVNATREDTASVLEQARALGITNILALRGDPPGGVGDFQKTEGGFEYSYELVRFIKDMGGFSIGVAGFPEGHIAQTDGKYADWQHLKHKIDQGADFVITQLFFNNRDYFEFRDYLASLGVTVPLVPGIMPIQSAAQIKRIVALCGADLPQPFVTELDKRGDNDEAVAQFGIEYATRQCEELLRRRRAGATLLHAEQIPIDRAGRRQSQPRKTEPLARLQGGHMRAVRPLLFLMTLLLTLALSGGIRLPSAPALPSASAITIRAGIARAARTAASAT